MQQFLKVDMRGSVILYVLLPPLSEEYRVVTFKVRQVIFLYVAYKQDGLNL